MSKMIQVLFECKGVSCERLAKRLAKFEKSFPMEFKLWKHDNIIYLKLFVGSITELNKAMSSLKRIRGIELFCSKVNHTLPRWRKWLM